VTAGAHVVQICVTHANGANPARPLISIPWQYDPQVDPFWRDMPRFLRTRAHAAPRVFIGRLSVTFRRRLRARLGSP